MLVSKTFLKLILRFIFGVWSISKIRFGGGSGIFMKTRFVRGFGFDVYSEIRFGFGFGFGIFQK